jgi:hypothetical protein
MLDPYALQLRQESLEEGRIIDALSIPIIPWGSDCCYGCELYQSGITITAHGFCPIQQRPTSPHYFCEKYEQD